MVVSLAPFVPSRPEVVRRMLEIASVGPDDVVFDLGCGDGRILVAAVRDFGVKKAVGYELRKDLFEKTSENIRKQGLGGKITLVNDDLLKADLSEATVIALYLTTSGNKTLRPKLVSEAKGGTRIVSHDFSFAEWYPSIREEFHNHTIYLYRIPEALTKKARPRSFFFKFY